MDGHVDLGLVARDDGRRGKCHERVFHTTHWEGWRHHDDRVVAPGVILLDILDGGIEINLQLAQADGIFCNCLGLTDNAGVGSSRHIDDMADNDGGQVVGDGDRAVEAVLVVPIHRGEATGPVGTHVNVQVAVSVDTRAVSYLNGGGVLERDHSSAVDVLTLRVHVRVDLAGGLFWG